MSLGTSIEWTDATWNPVRGCTKISAGCKNCYAERFSERFRGVPGHPFEQGFDIRLVPEKLAEPLKWTEPRLVFVNSMSDLFHDRVPVEYIDRVVELMIKANWHTFQVLTKRGSRLESLLNSRYREAAALPHIWWGVSVENKAHGVPRIRHLQNSPAAMRFLSIEPLLEDVGNIDLSGISWVIVGGESGPGARPIHAEWVRSLQRQCAASDVAFFFKQWGGVQKKTAGRMLDGRFYDELPPRRTRECMPTKARVELITAISHADISPLPILS